MVSPEEGVCLYSEQLDLEKNSLRNAILTLATEWNNLEKHLDSTKESVDKCLADIKLKRQNLESDRDSMVESNKELDSVRESLTIQLKKLECEKEKFRFLQELQIEELKMKEVQLGGVQLATRKELEEVEWKEERLNQQHKLMEVLLEKFEKEKHDFVDIKMAAGEKLNEISLKERSLEVRSKELEEREKQLDSKEDRLKAVQKFNEDHGEELNIKERELEEWSKQLRLKEDQLKSDSKKRKRLSNDDSFTSRDKNGYVLTSDDSHMESPLAFREAFDMLGLSGMDSVDKVKLRVIEVANRTVFLEGKCRAAIEKTGKLEAVNKDLLEKQASINLGFEAAIKNCLKQVKAIGDGKPYSEGRPEDDNTDL